MDKSEAEAEAAAPFTLRFLKLIEELGAQTLDKRRLFCSLSLDLRD